MTNPNDATERIAQLRASLSPKGKRFFDEYRQRSEAVSDAIRRGGDTDLHQMATQVWIADQLPTLSEHDREVAMKAIQLWSIQTISGERELSGEQIIEELVEEAQKDPDRARHIISQAQQLQVYAGEPLSQNMDVREAGEVLKRLSFDPDV